MPGTKRPPDLTVSDESVNCVIPVAVWYGAVGKTVLIPPPVAPSVPFWKLLSLLFSSLQANSWNDGGAVITLPTTIPVAPFAVSITTERERIRAIQDPCLQRDGLGWRKDEPPTDVTQGSLAG